jgi:phytanoyl-CoA hydroxylase
VSVRTLASMMSTTAQSAVRRVSIAEYVHFRREGYLIVRGLMAPDEVRELLDHVEDPMFAAVERIHMLHRRLEIHERFMLHPGVLDVVQALVGPDVLALQTMLFVKRPGSDGQGYHQDSFHIITEPDTLIGAWTALDRADEENGCLRVVAGSQNEPIYPDADESAGHGGDLLLADMFAISGADDPDERRNELTAVAAKYPGREVAAALDPGDVVFFGGHLLHRSHANLSPTRSRRAFVAHYCNARSYVPWDDEPLDPGEIGNGRHILARGETHIPFARPRFGTPCAATRAGSENGKLRL